MGKRTYVVNNLGRHINLRVRGRLQLRIGDSNALRFGSSLRLSNSGDVRVNLGGRGREDLRVGVLDRLRVIDNVGGHVDVGNGSRLEFSASVVNSLEVGQGLSTNVN